MKTVAIYTAIFGQYDAIPRPPIDLLIDADLYCFTDNVHFTSEHYQIIQVKRHFKDPVRCARHCKVLSHLYLEEYQYVIWHDANNHLKISSATQLLDDYLDDDADLSIFQHHLRNCIYREAEDCLKNGYDNPRLIQKQMKKYQKEGYPMNFGLVNSNFIIRRHTPEMIKFNNLWWHEIENGSRRDQLSFDYVRWKTNLKIKIIDGFWKRNEILEVKKHLIKVKPPYDLSSKMRFFIVEYVWRKWVPFKLKHILSRIHFLARHHQYRYMMILCIPKIIRPYLKKIF